MPWLPLLNRELKYSDTNCGCTPWHDHRSWHAPRNMCGCPQIQGSQCQGWAANYRRVSAKMQIGSQRNNKQSEEQWQFGAIQWLSAQFLGQQCLSFTQIELLTQESIIKGFIMDNLAILNLIVFVLFDLKPAGAPDIVHKLYKNSRFYYIPSVVSLLKIIILSTNPTRKLTVFVQNFIAYDMGDDFHLPKVSLTTNAARSTSQVVPPLAFAIIAEQQTQLTGTVIASQTRREMNIACQNIFIGSQGFLQNITYCIPANTLQNYLISLTLYASSLKATARHMSGIHCQLLAGGLAAEAAGRGCEAC